MFIYYFNIPQNILSKNGLFGWLLIQKNGLLQATSYLISNYWWLKDTNDQLILSEFHLKLWKTAVLSCDPSYHWLIQEIYFLICGRLCHGVCSIFGSVWPLKMLRFEISWFWEHKHKKINTTDKIIWRLTSDYVSTDVQWYKAISIGLNYSVNDSLDFQYNDCKFESSI